MYRRRKEQLRRLMKHFLWLNPVLILMVMFVLGACTHTRTDSYQTTNATVQETLQLIEETTAAPTAAVPYVEPVPSSASAESTESETEGPAGLDVRENGNYTSKEEVALYLHRFGRLPSNYITKRKAEERGWDSGKGNLATVLPGMSIGGSGFGNYEGLLPTAQGRKYYECDIDYNGGYRNAKRIIYSNDGLIFYTEDHYKSFEQLY